jgi:hypothetical protein
LLARSPSLLYEKIDGFGKAGLRVKTHGVTTHNQVSNAMGMEGGQKVFVAVWIISSTASMRSCTGRLCQ